MAKTKHVADAHVLINDYIEGLPAWSKRICTRLYSIILKADSKIIEDWKWGPNFYCEGMLCGFAAFQKYVALVFFKGAFIKDKHQLFRNGESINTRTIEFKDAGEVDEDKILDYLFQAIDNNRKGKKDQVKQG